MPVMLGPTHITLSGKFAPDGNALVSMRTEALRTWRPDGQFGVGGMQGHAAVALLLACTEAERVQPGVEASRQGFLSCAVCVTPFSFARAAGRPGPSLATE
jgi:hypothetical protein